MGEGGGIQGLGDHRRMPGALGPGVLVHAIAALGQGLIRAPALATGLALADQRHAGLLGEVVGDLGDRPVRRDLVQFAPQIVGDGIAIGVGGHVAAHAVAEGGLADIGLQHADHRLALVIGDLVEGAAGLQDVVDRGDDRVRAVAGVGLHGALLAGLGLQPDLPLRMEVVGGLILHPRGEALVQPKVVPPGHGH